MKQRYMQYLLSLSCISFPGGSNKGCEAIPAEITEKDIRGRRDFLSVPTFTIDPLMRGILMMLCLSGSLIAATGKPE
jgi:hypothetical protein